MVGGLCESMIKSDAQFEVWANLLVSEFDSTKKIYPQTFSV